MIALLVALALIAPVIAAAQAPQRVNELRAMARSGPDSALVERVRRRSDDARDALPGLLAEAARGTSDSAQASALAAANRLAVAIAVAWRDSFPLRQVARFQSLSPAQRQATVEADSVVRAGRAAFGRVGHAAAMGMLRDGLRRFEALADTSGLAAAMNGLGYGFYNIQEYDSAVAYLTRAGGFAERIGDLRVGGNVFINLGLVSWKQGDLRSADESLARARQVFERIGDGTGLRLTEKSFGLIAQSRGDLAGARRAWEAALAASRNSGDAEQAAASLNNLGRLEMREGDYPRADARYREALSIYRKLGNQQDVADELLNLGRLAMRRGDYAGAITVFSEAAAIVRRIGPGPGTSETVLVELAEARTMIGDLEGARKELDWAEALLNRPGGAGRGASLANLALARGRLAFMFNRLAEAERQFARAKRLARGAASAQDRTRFRILSEIAMANVFFKRGSYQRAQIAMEQLLLEPSLDTHNKAMVRAQLSEAAWHSGDTATARQALMQVLDAVRALDDARSEATVLHRLGDLEARSGHLLAAESLYQRGLTRLDAKPAPEVALQLRAGLAASLRRRGALADAAHELLAGIREIEGVAGSLQLEEQRSAFQADKWAMYVDLALIEYARGRTVAAFEASERLRGRQMLDLLARGRVGEKGLLHALSVREQDLSRRIRALAEQVEAQAGKESAVSALRDPAPAGERASSAAMELARLQEDYEQLLLEIRAANPSYAALVRGTTVPARSVMAALAPDEVLLEYLVGDSTTLIFVVTADTVAALDITVSHDALAAQVDFARSTLAPPTGETARRTWRAPLRRLYRQLVGPVEASGLLAGKRRLIIAPHAELHYLPFSALLRAGPPEQPLVDRYLIEYVSSASVWLRLRERPEPARGRGILALAPRAKALPGSRAEVAAIRRIYGDRAQTLVGSPATEHAFRDLAPGQEIVHLATYGVLNKHNPLFSFVEMGAGGGEDGRLEVHEVFGLTLTARLLVLSACQTGLAAGALADVPPGDDWVGLVQGFLYAGASNVLATLWPVADVATARLMERFYRELAAGRSEAEALALMQRGALRDSETAHPFFWAGFTLVRGR